MVIIFTDFINKSTSVLILIFQNVLIFTLKASAGVSGGTGGIPFEVWCRYYYPNVRDKVIAKVCYV